MAPPYRPRSTQYLDGLRGYAAVVVFIHHYSRAYLRNHMEHVYGFGDHQSILQLPILRLIYSGFPMVAIFYVISGYVLSYKPVHDPQAGRLLVTLSSPAFRRGIRLFVPPIVSTFLVMLAIQCNLYDTTGHPSLHRFDSFGGQLRDWIQFVRLELLSLWSWDDSTSYRYDPNLWTITSEFQCSMLLLLSHLLLARKSSAARLVFWLLFAAYAMQNGIFEAALFHIGAFIAEIRALPHFTRNGHDGLLYRYFWTMAVTCGAYFASYPDREGARTPAFSWLPSLTSWQPFEDCRAWQMLGAIILVFGLSFDNRLQRPFVSPVAQYLGRISYGIYLCHGPLLNIAQRPLLLFVWDFFTPENDSNTVFWAAFLIVLPVLFFCLLFLATAFWWLVDKPSTRLARWLEMVTELEEDQGRH
ncbi:uncharacterized protein N7496_007320 [Penicillium cataractarum]|uniref:Acyltransferase 3 domain-containing protein n=1 Tax=Penicillium cataractarum TaxID=2100454 RepID=A0A9W9V6Z4_9EURO|nr:uncharacterized protein N7496_007320 [Penicillium cataractarum]KAJ5371228.1 hypothetical protein N7496_007320 [Penicillium cataractarum]